MLYLLYGNAPLNYDYTLYIRPCYTLLYPTTNGVLHGLQPTEAFPSASLAKPKLQGLSQLHLKFLRMDEWSERLPISNCFPYWIINWLVKLPWFINQQGLWILLNWNFLFQTTLFCHSAWGFMFAIRYPSWLDSHLSWLKHAKTIVSHPCSVGRWIPPFYVRRTKQSHECWPHMGQTYGSNHQASLNKQLLKNPKHS